MTSETHLVAAEEKAWQRGYDTGLAAGKDYAVRGLEPPAIQQPVCSDVFLDLIAELRTWTTAHGRDIYVSGSLMARHISRLLDDAEARLGKRSGPAK